MDIFVIDIVIIISIVYHIVISIILVVFDTVSGTFINSSFIIHYRSGYVRSARSHCHQL